MPELPEVETVVRYLKPRLTGKVIASVHLPSEYRKAIHNCSLGRLNSQLKGQAILDVTRRAKYIVLSFQTGIVCIHLRMTGRVLLSPPPQKERKYVTAWFSFTDGSRCYFKDVRKFGRIHYYEHPETFHAALGIEPLSASFNGTICYKLLQTSKRAIKPFLLDQTKIVGIGNIYADEILWACKVHPLATCSTLSTTTAKLLCTNTKKILRKSIERNGTTFQSFYYGEEASGEFTSLLQVFGKTGNPCPRCNHAISKIRVAQRGTHLCTHCQSLS